MSPSAPASVPAPELAVLAAGYRRELLDDVLPFWLAHGLDREHGGIITTLDYDGTVVDDDKSIWFQGRAGWMFATLWNTVERRPEWLHAARSCVAFLRQHGRAPDGKLWFSVTRDGRPLRMRRYVYSESFAAIACGALSRAEGDPALAEEALAFFATYLHHSFAPGVMPPKTEPATRPMTGIGPRMIAIATAQALRADLGERSVSGLSLSAWIDRCIAEIRRLFVRDDLSAVLEVVAPDGALIEHAEGRTLNPGHAIECAWFIMEEGRLRGDAGLIALGCRMLDWMWARGWDREYGGLLYFCDLRERPVPEYWQDMKFWWPHNEAEIACLMAWRLTGEARYARWHRAVREWSRTHFADPVHGEWFGWLRRDGSPSSTLKGSLFKGPFHLPRMLWRCAELASAPAVSPGRSPSGLS